MFDILGKFQEMQQKMETTKAKLDTIFVEGEAGSGAIRVTVSASKRIKNIEMVDAIFAEGDKDQLEDMLLVAINRAMEKAEAVAAAEMKAVTGDIMPNMPGLPF